MSGSTSNNPPLQTRVNLQTYSGNRLIVLIGGVRVGLVQSARLDDNYGLEGASGVGDIHVREYVPSKAVHRVSVSNMVLFAGNLRDLGIAPENGDAVLLGVVLDIVSYSRDTGKPVRQYLGCSYDSGSTDIAAHRITMQSGSFMALDAKGKGL